MSRVGQMPIPCPSGVEVKIQGSRVEVQGPKGALSRELHPSIAIVEEDGILRLDRVDDSALPERSQRPLQSPSTGRRK